MWEHAGFRVQGLGSSSDSGRAMTLSHACGLWGIIRDCLEAQGAESVGQRQSYKFLTGCGPAASSPTHRPCSTSFLPAYELMNLCIG